MIASRTATIRSTIELLSLTFVSQQIALGMLVLGLFTLWLRLPDSSILYVACTVLLGLLILFLAGCGESWLLFRLTRQTPTRAKLLRGALVIFVIVALWLAWNSIFEHLAIWDQRNAGYLNSQSPHSLRNIFTYDHIVRWLGWAGLLLESIGGGVLSATAFALVTSTHSRTHIKVILRSGIFWVVFLINAFFVPSWIWAIAQWTPGHGLTVEIFSLMARLSLVILLSGIAISFILATLAACTRPATTT